MPADQPIHRLYQLFADILEYPTPGLAEQVGACGELLATVSPEAAARLAGFQGFVDQTPLGRLEEIYTGTFDLQVVCYPYVGYQLFGESYKRGAFLAKLNGEYRAHGFSAEGELPDHLAVVLRFLAVVENEDVKRDLITECLVPALERMKQPFEGKANPYSEVIRALSLVFQGDTFRNTSNRERVNGRQLAPLPACETLAKAGMET